MVLGKKVNPYVVDIKVTYIQVRKSVNSGIVVKMKQCHCYYFLLFLMLIFLTRL